MRSLDVGLLAAAAYPQEITLGFAKTAEQKFGGNERWITVSPRGQKGAEIVLAKAQGDRAALTGKQALWVFRTDDCQRTYEASAPAASGSTTLAKAGWGMQAIFEDRYGNEFVLISDR